MRGNKHIVHNVEFYLRGAAVVFIDLCGSVKLAAVLVKSGNFKHRIRIIQNRVGQRFVSEVIYRNYGVLFIYKFIIGQVVTGNFGKYKVSRSFNRIFGTDAHCNLTRGEEIVPKVRKICRVVKIHNQTVVH